MEEPDAAEIGGSHRRLRFATYRQAVAQVLRTSPPAFPLAMPCEVKALRRSRLPAVPESGGNN